MRDEEFLKRRSVLALGLFIGAVFLVWWQPLGLSRPFQGFLSTLTLPFQNFLSWGSFEFSDTRDFFGSIGQLKQENASLKKENLRLTGEVARLRSFETENTTLREITHLDGDGKNTMVNAEVVGRDVSGFSTTLTINRGSSQGIAVGMPVIGVGRVLVGRTISVFPFTSVVELLSHPESITSAALVSTDSKGVVRGDHGLGMIFDLALQSESLKPGEAVVTSGLGDGFPHGLLIGTIESIHPSSDRLFQQAIVISPIRFDALRFVSVIIR
ncbi:MAG: rod shape-determining protein MreC [Candidatus Moraniibacteriota bacterium]